LCQGKGLAVDVVGAKEGLVIPGHSSRAFTLVVHSDMCGTYLDTLRCLVGDGLADYEATGVLPEPRGGGRGMGMDQSNSLVAPGAVRQISQSRIFPLRIGIIGSPLLVQATRHQVQGYFPDRLTDVAVDFGEIPQKLTQTRSIFVRNTSPFPVKLTWSHRSLAAHVEAKRKKAELVRHRWGVTKGTVGAAGAFAAAAVAVAKRREEEELARQLAEEEAAAAAAAASEEGVDAAAATAAATATPAPENGDGEEATAPTSASVDAAILEMAQRPKKKSEKTFTGVSLSFEPGVGRAGGIKVVMEPKHSQVQDVDAVDPDSGALLYPYRIDPPMAVIAGGDVCRFDIRYSADTKGSGLIPDEAMLVGTQEMIKSDAAAAQLMDGVTMLGLPNKTRALADTGVGTTTWKRPAKGTLMSTVGGATADNGTGVDGEERVSISFIPGSKNLHADDDDDDDDAPEGGDGESHLTCMMKGSYHPYAAQPDLDLGTLRVRLVGRTAGSRLETDLGHGAVMKWDVASSDPSSHSSYTQTVTLTNPQKGPMAFRLAVDGPWQMTGVNVSVPLQEAKAKMVGTSGLTQTLKGGFTTTENNTLQGLPRKSDLSILSASEENLSLSSMLQGGESSSGLAPSMGGLVLLPPRESAEVTLHLTVPQDRLGRDQSDFALEGMLRASFANGDFQELPLAATVRCPELMINTEVVEFGAVHVQAPKPMQVVLTNKSTSGAFWTVVDLDDPDAQVIFPKTVEEAREGPKGKEVQCGRINVAPRWGYISGRGLKMPNQQNVTVTFGPQLQGPYTKRLAFAVYQGRGCEVQVQGQGTLDETQEHLGILKQLPY